MYYLKTRAPHSALSLSRGTVYVSVCKREGLAGARVVAIAERGASNRDSLDYAQPDTDVEKF